MPDNDNKKPTSSPFDIVTSSKSKKGKKGIVVAALIVAFLVLSVVAGVLLVRQRQNIQEKADTGSATCASGYSSTHLHECKSSCSNENSVGDPWYWINATSGASCPNGPAGESRRWCDLDECEILSTPTPTTVPTIIPSPSAFPSATASASGTPKSATSSSTLKTTPRPIPETGVDWPTAAGVFVGIGAIAISILLAL